ncbi:MAG: hypothetical protein ABFS37_03695 [Acidobacteriota bacterium]
MKKTVLALLAIILVAGTPFAQEAPPVTEVTGEDELVKEKGRYQETWVRPDADMSRYSRLYLWHPEFEFREGGDTTTGTEISRSRGEQGPFEIRKESREKFEQVVSDVVVKELARSKVFEVVNEVGPDTLIVRASVLDIISNVPPNVASTRTRVHLASVGEATIVFELIDAETGVIQARIAERRRIQPPGRMHQVSAVPANSVTVWNDITLWASGEAQTLRRELDKVKKKSEK